MAHGTIADKNGFTVLSELRQLLGRLKAKPDKYKLDAFLEKLVCEIEDLQTEVENLRGGR